METLYTLVASQHPQYSAVVPSGVYRNCRIACVIDDVVTFVFTAALGPVYICQADVARYVQQR